MPRANRHSLPNYIWHITHRCHDRSFLLKFARDRRAWIRWLWRAKRRFGLSVLSYIVTSNHAHLLVMDSGQDEIARSVHLIAGSVAQQFNRRKGRKGAFWDDRYHATAVSSDGHLLRCLTYIDLNMVRAGVVEHPRDWSHSAYAELRSPRLQGGIVDVRALLQLVGCRDREALVDVLDSCVDEALKGHARSREPAWTDSLAVGSREFVARFKTDLGTAGRYREISEQDGASALRDEVGNYRVNF